MADDVRLSLDTRAFEQAALNLAAHSKRDSETFIKEQVRGLLRTVIEMTPPARGGIRGTKAKRMGEQAVTSDIRAVFSGVTKPERAEVKDLSAMQAALRSRRSGSKMRVAKGGEKIPAPRQMITELIRLKKARVGYLGSAWASAAKSIGKIRVPAWIGRHAAPGNTRISRDDGIITASITNAVEWASGVDGLNRRVTAALGAQTRAMEKRLKFYLENIKKKSGWKG